MKNSKRFMALGMAAMLAMGTLAGCGSDNGGNNSTNNAGNGTESTAADNKGNENTAAGGSVYYLNFKPEQDEQWQALAKTYTEQTYRLLTDLKSYMSFLSIPNRQVQR